jgi:ABC-type multidrug transport system fused ATPase/permease subunit
MKYEKALQSTTNEEVDELKSKKAFDFKNIELNIKVLQEDVAEVSPKKAKATLLVALSLALMIYTSWPLALMCFVLLLIIGVVVLLGNLAYIKRQSSSQQLQESLADAVRKSFKT